MFQTSCDLSNVNLCKGQVLREYLSERGPFPFVAYAGDGANDFCPMCTVLESKDMAFPRAGERYAITKHINKMRNDKGLEIKAERCFWSHGKDILQALRYRVNQGCD